MVNALAKHSEKLIYFYEIANYHSLQGAGRALGISAPSLSHAIKQLESVLGFAVFKRSSRGVTLTAKGARLYSYCQKMFREMDDLQKTFSACDPNNIQKIRIGTFPSIAIYLWPLIFENLKLEPNISASITTGRSHDILEALVSRKIDLAITLGSVSHNKLNRQELYQDDYGFFISKKANAKLMKRKALKEIDLFYFPDAKDTQGRSLQQYVSAWNLPFKEVCEIDSFEVIGEFVRNNYGIGILPIKSARIFKKELNLLQVDGVPQNFGTHHFYISYRNDLEIKQRTLDFIINSSAQSVVKMNQQSW